MRYEEYKETGDRFCPELPTSWNIKSGRFCFEENKKKNVDLTEKTLLQFTYGSIVRKKNQAITKDDEPIIAKYTVVQPFDIMLNGLNLNYDFVSQRVGLVSEPGIITSAYLSLRCHDVYNPYYANYMLKALDAQKIFHGMGSGVRLTLGYPEFSKIKFPVPPREEQDQIVRYLDWKVSCINKLIHGYQRQIKLLEERRLFVINEAVTKGIDNGTSFKDSGIRWIGEIPVHWHVVSLKRCATLRSGITLGKKYPRNVELIEVPYLRVANVQNGYIDISDVATLLVTQEEAEKYRLSAGEVLMTEGGDRDKLGRGSVWNGSISPCIHQNHVYAVKTNEKKLNNRFLEYLTVSNVAREYFDLTATKTTNLASTNSSKVLAFPIPLPPVDEQQRIVEYLIQSDEKIQMAKARIQKQVLLMQEYRTRLISDVVTGQMDVRGVTVPEYVPETDEEDEEIDETLSDAGEESEV